MLAELPVDGTRRKVLMQANRNGFFYVLDRTNGKLLSANAFSKKINWATGIDLKTGRPIDTEMTQMVRTNVKTPELEVWPSAMGGKNWMPMSFDPVKKRVYMNTLNLGMKVTYNQPAYKQGAWYLGLDLGGFFGPDERDARQPDGLGPGGWQGALGGAHRNAVLGRCTFHRRRSGVHRRADRRVSGLRCGHRREALAVSDRLGHHRTAHHLGTQGPAVRDGHQRGRQPSTRSSATTPACSRYPRARRSGPSG